MGPIIPDLRTLTALGCEEFHTNLYGQNSTVYTDHKPLESINLKQRPYHLIQVVWVKKAALEFFPFVAKQ